MNGLTPWEIATLKVAYHRFDTHHKGYLSAEDFDGLCVAAGLNLSPAETQALFLRVDDGRDGRVSFDEFVRCLATVPLWSDGAGDSTDASYSDSAARIRLHCNGSSGLAAACAGGVLGLFHLLKTKLVVMTGTLFYDPIRLFRDNFVDYGEALRAAALKRNLVSTNAADIGLWQAARLHTRAAGSLLPTAGWILFAVLLDCLGGAVMFTTYAMARQHLSQNPRTAKLLADRPRSLEMAAGFCGGAAGGMVERPLQYMARHHIMNPVALLHPCVGSSALEGASFSVFRGASSHALFFGAFFTCSDALRRLLYRRLQVRQTSATDSCVTVFAGCGAGAAYRAVSHPLLQVFLATGAAQRPLSRTPRIAEYVRQHGGGVRAARAAYRGFGASLVWVMPATGLAFLLYERLLIGL